MSLLKLENISRQFRTEPLWSGFSLSIELNERIGIIGANGSGKTSLLKIMAGLEEPDNGRAIIAKDIKIGFLPQTPQFDPQMTVLETICHSQAETALLLEEYEELCAEMRPDNTEKIDKLAAEIEARGGWQLKDRAKEVASRLHIRNLNAKMGELSVGQQKRAAIAQALLDDPDLLLLDEPTNHLDTVTIDWLESCLKSFRGSLVVVTHDRYFLERATRKIIEIEQGTITLYEGSYSEYLEKKAHQKELDAQSEEKRANFIRREMAWFRRGARARSTKQKARQERLMEILSQKRPGPEKKLSMKSLSTASHLGTKGIILHNISKSYGEHKVISNFSLELMRGDRIGLVGANGSGKTTLLSIMAEIIAPDQGYVELGQTVVIGRYAQDSLELDPGKKALDYIREAAEVIHTPDGRVITAETMMENFLFPRSMQSTLIGKLSGGEKRRLYLLWVLMQSPNVLLLDEPTNDLDLPTLMRLEAWLDDFPGILVVVSHDRYFLDRTVDRLWYLSQGNPREFMGDYDTLRDTLMEEAKSSQPVKPHQEKPELPAVPKKKKKLTYNEERELGLIEKAIETDETRLAEIEAELATPSSDAEAVSKLYTEKTALEAKLEKAMLRWEELASKKEELAN
ncbi:MAG: ABC-F family ATP-binding cassette domain-containing protein [bacterium]|nr:ABC-F family ATP-binding cassette domain-containing protein [bacterium]